MIPYGLKLNKKMQMILMCLMVLDLPFKLFRKILNKIGWGNGRVI